MARQLSHSELAAKLVVEGCLAIVAGTAQGKMPMEGMPVTELERTQLGLTQGGKTVFYALRESGVFLDLHGAHSSVFFADYDFDRGLPALETALKSAYPKAKQLKDTAHPRKKNYRYRSYEIDFGKGRLAHLEIEIPSATADKRKFMASVTAMARKN